MKKPVTKSGKVRKRQRVKESELKFLDNVLPWVRVPVGKGRLVHCVPVEPDMRNRLTYTIREQRKQIKELRAEIDMLLTGKGEHFSDDDEYMGHPI